MKENEFKILLIDDDEDDYVNIRDLFADNHRGRYDITWKSSYQEGLEALLKEQFDACLLDYRLGEKTGLDLLLEAQKFGNTCPMIFLTGHGDFDLDLKAMQVGAADYLVKGQLTSPLLERSIRYAMKHTLDLQELKNNRAQILQQDRLASLGLLASSLAHEIGTPMGIIRSRAEMVARKAKDNESLKSDMDTVVTQIDRVTKLVNSLLHLARGKQSEFASIVSLNQIFQDVLNLLNHEFERKNIKFSLDIPENCRARAEAGPLGQVLINLLINSVHAIEEARKLGREDGHSIHIKVEDRKETLRINVTDTGSGIAPENLAQIFKPFFTTKDVGLGTGLGLATSYKLVQSWGGSLSVQSRSGQGTTFTISLGK